MKTFGRGVPFGSFMLATALLARALVADADQAAPLPTVYAGNGHYGYATPLEGCQAQVDLGMFTVPPGATLFVDSSVNSSMVSGVVDHSTPGFGGWRCGERHPYWHPHLQQWIEVSNYLGWMYPVCPPSNAPGSILSTGSIEWLSNGRVSVREPYSCPAYVDQVESCQATEGARSGAITTSNPVACRTGEKIQTEVDFAGGGLTFTRYFRSQPTANPAATPGWGSADEVSFVLLKDTTYGRLAELRFGDGGRLLFNGASNASTLTSSTPSHGTLQLTGGSWQWRGARGTRYVFGANGRPVSKTVNGQITYYDWQTVGSTVRLAQVTNALGRALQLTYDAAGRLEHLIDPGGAITEYSYDTQNRLIRVTFADLHFKQYLYEDALLPNHLTGVIDENGDRYATYAYDSSGRTILSEHAGHAQKATFSYPSASNTVVRYHQSATSYRDKLYVIDQAHGTDRLLRDEDYACNDCTTGTIINEYDSNGWLKKSTNRNGIVTTYTLDSSGRETSRTEAYGTSSARTISTSWDTTWNKPWRIDQGQHRRQHTYTATGLLATSVELDTALGTSRTMTYTYNAQGLLSSLDGPRTDAPDVTTYTYDTEGNLATITNALGHLTQITVYDDNGRPLTMIDPNGVTTTLVYTARGWLKSRTVGGEATNFDYDAAGQLIRVTFPDGSDIEYEYDAAHRLIRIENVANERIEYTLDYAGNRLQEQVFGAANNLMQVRSSVFNALNQLLRELNATNGIVATYEYDANGNTTDIHAALGRDTSNVYDALDRLLQVVDPLSGVSQYGYNVLDQLTSVTDPRGKVTNYTYNALGDMTQQVSPDGGTTTHTYDSGGNLKSRTDARSKTATYSYDALNRVTGVTYPDQTIGYSYDTGSHQKGRLTQVSDGSGSTLWTYDTHGRVLSRQQVVGAVTKSLGYAYDAFGRLQTLTLPSGNTITYGYTNGKVTSLTLNGSTPILSNALYQPFGPTSGWTWGNATLAVREYDTDGKVTDIDSAGLKTYSYDTAFRITGITDATDPNLSQSYGYDLLDRLTSATGTGLNQSWTYDANGNRLTQGGSQSSTYAVSSTSNRLSSISGALSRSYSYDAAGNITGDGTVTFTYNDAGRMVSATKAGVTTNYVLNALGQRVKKTTSGASTYFVYDEAGHLVGEYDNSGSLIQEPLWLGDAPVALLKPSGASVNVYYVHTDHLNTPRRISRPSDNVVVWRWDPDPFGTSTANEDPDGDSSAFSYNLRFPGQYFDAETGLHYNYFRDGYDVATGRYIQSDPIGLFGGINTYAYVVGNPVSYVDSYGLVPGTGPRKPPTITNPAAIGVFGCTGLACVSCSTGDSETQVSMELSVGGGIEICDSLPPPFPPPAPRKKGGDCGMQDRRCDDQLQPPGFPVPKRFGGLIIGAGFKRDGRFCVRIGPHVSIPFLPSLELGGISE